MVMARKWANRYRGIFSSLLMTVFFASQVFSCCLVNQKLAHFLETAFTGNAFQETASHSCCPHASTGSAGAEKPAGPDHDAARDTHHQGCCIQDANAKLPQIPSEAMPAPVMPEQLLGFLSVSILDLPSLPARPDLRSSSGPPVYLTQLRLLI